VIYWPFIKDDPCEPVPAKHSLTAYVCVYYTGLSLINFLRVLWSVYYVNCRQLVDWICHLCCHLVYLLKVTRGAD